MTATSPDTNTADSAYVKRAMKAPLLDPEHEKKLAKRWRDKQDDRALHELTTAYMRLVIAMASKFKNYGLPVADLIQEGSVGLMQAAARFDPDREVRFSTYASWWIRSSIQDYVLRNWSIVRTGTTAAQKSLFFNLRRLRAKIHDTDDGMMTAENKAWVADHLGVAERDVENMAARLSGADRSLNAPLATDGEVQWQDLLPDTAPQPEEAYMGQNDSRRRAEWVAKAMNVLNERERMIISKRRLSDRTVTLEVLGDQLGISKERVRQIEHHAMAKLRRALENLVGDVELAGLVPDT